MSRVGYADAEAEGAAVVLGDAWLMLQLLLNRRGRHRLQGLLRRRSRLLQEQARLLWLRLRLLLLTVHPAGFAVPLSLGRSRRLL